MRNMGTSLTETPVLALLNAHPLVHSPSFGLTMVASAAIWLVFLLACLRLCAYWKPSDPAENQDEPEAVGIRGVISRHVTRVGGLTIFCFKMTRFVALAIHLGLVVGTALHRGWSTLAVVLAEASVSTGRG